MRKNLKERGSKMNIGSIIIKCYEFDQMFEFWQEALRYVPRGPAEDGWVVLCDPRGKGPNLSLDRVAEKRSGKRSRLHPDLYTESIDGVVERLVDLGALSYPWRYEKHHDYIVLEDPDGNLFCVVQKDFHLPSA